MFISIHSKFTFQSGMGEFAVRFAKLLDRNTEWTRNLEWTWWTVKLTLSSAVEIIIIIIAFWFMPYLPTYAVKYTNKNSARKITEGNFGLAGICPRNLRYCGNSPGNSSGDNYVIFSWTRVTYQGGFNLKLSRNIKNVTLI